MSGVKCKAKTLQHGFLKIHATFYNSLDPCETLQLSVIIIKGSRQAFKTLFQFLLINETSISTVQFPSEGRLGGA